MAVWVHNISQPGLPDDSEHEYRLMINRQEMCRFRHRRDEGLAACLRRAADAFEAADKAKDVGSGRADCSNCSGTGRVPTINADGRYGPLYPMSLGCTVCGGTGLSQ